MAYDAFTPQQIELCNNLSQDCRTKIRAYLETPACSAEASRDRMNEALNALLPSMNTGRLNPKQSKRIAHRRAQKLLQAYVAAHK